MYKLFPLLLFASLIDSSHAYASGTYDCPLPWISNAEYCYRFVLFTASITDAKANCAEDGAKLVEVRNIAEHDFIIRWLQANAKDRYEWFTGGVRDSRASGPDGSNIKYVWESDQTEVAGLQFWFSLQARQKPGNRIVYYTDGGKWGWSILDDTPASATRPYICQISKEFLYKIVKVDRGFDFGVNEIDPVQLQKGPVLIVQPVDTVYDPASAITRIIMNCEADANPLASYEWFVNRELRRSPVNLTDPKITITSGRLTIEQPSDTTHNGDYQCVASNSFGSVLSNRAQLTFGYLNDFPKSNRDPVVATAFTGTGIECIPPKSGYSTLSYIWYKDSFLNFIRPNVKWYTFVSSDGKLYFQFVTKDDEGNYWCLVSRPNTLDNFQEGKLSMPIPLRVTETVGSEQEPQIVNSFPKAFPSSPQVGDDVRMECIAFGTSVTQMAYSWNRTDGKAMPSNANFSDYNRVMSIPNIQLSHAGRYQCLVSRRLGLFTTGEIALSVEARPYFTIPLQDQHVDKESTVNWICVAGGVPMVTYLWYINGTVLNTTRMAPDTRSRFRLANNELTITSVQPSDAGMYQCSASNEHGMRMSSAQLRVLWFPPSFTKFPLQPNTYGTLMGNATLICNPESAPPSKKTWLKNGIGLNPSKDPQQRVHELPNGNLHLTQLQSDDSGNYTCEADNGLGQASSTGQLTVLPTTTISQPPRDMVVMVNQTTFLFCGASYSPAIDITYDWWHNTYKVMFVKVRNLGNSVYVYKEPHYTRGTGINRGGLYINYTQFFHAGTYSCIAKSSSQEIKAISRLTVIGPPGEPAGIVCSNPTQTNMTLTFWPGRENGKPITSYIVESRNRLEMYWKLQKTGIPPSADVNTRITTVVGGLSPYAQYEFRAAGINSLGQGVPSKISAICQTDQAPPVEYPANLGGGGGKVGTLNISWDAMPVSAWNADPSRSGYVIYWKRGDMADDQWDHERINNTKLTKFVKTVGQNFFYTRYNIRIQAYNPMGVGPMSPTVTIMSAEDLPKGVPISVKAVYYNATAITVEWRPVDDTVEVMRGLLLGYRINYWIDQEEEETMALFKIIRNQTDHGLIIGLRENTNYMINVQALNTAGNGPKSENYRTKTLRAAPVEAPQDVRISIVDHEAVLITWRGVYTTIDEEPLNGYTVRYWKRGENIYVATNRDAGKEIRYVLSGLEQFVQYELRVFGYSRGGDGLQSSPTMEFILGPDCEIREDSPDKEYIYKCDACRTRSSAALFAALMLFLGRILLQS